MQTPDTRAGRLTEEVMTNINKKLKLPIHIYNPIYSAVLETLEREFRGFETVANEIENYYKNK